MAAPVGDDFYLAEASLYAGNSTKTPEESIEWFFLPFSPVSSSWLARDKHHWSEEQRRAKERAARMDTKRERRLREEPLSPERPGKMMKVSPTKKLG